MNSRNGPLVGASAPADDFTSHIDEHHTACIVYAERMLGSRADAEDAVQDTWLRAFRAYARFDSSRPFRPWLFRILVNTVGSHLRRRKRWWSRWIDAVDPDAVASRSDDADGVQLDALRVAVMELPPTLREAFLLKYVSEMSYPEMADVTGATISALKMRVNRAVAALRPQLESMEHIDES
jgi:RNA polymerase sigma-70 factor (ECF subfamily)